MQIKSRRIARIGYLSSPGSLPVLRTREKVYQPTDDALSC
jgi:hypothetical protein